MTAAEDSRNAIQKACTNLSQSDAELVLGEVYGLRQWRVVTPGGEENRETGGLLGHYNAIWDPSSVNVAHCKVKHTRVSTTFSIDVNDAFGRPPAEVIADEVRAYLLKYPEDSTLILNLDLPGMWYPSRTFAVTPDFIRHPNPQKVPWNLVAHSYRQTWLVAGSDIRSRFLPVKLTATRKVDPHPVAFPACTCGFYAYTDVDSLLVNSAPNAGSVFGVVKAYGRVTHGTKGFRAEKAEVVALTRPLDAPPGDLIMFILHSYAGMGAPPRSTWLPTEKEELREFFDTVIPEKLPVYQNLDDLLDEYGPLIEPYREEDK